MSDSVLKPKLESELEKETIAPDFPDSVLQVLERDDLFLPVATEVSPVSPESRVVVYNDPRSAGSDRFRLIQLRLKSLQASKKLKTLLITSPLPGDGKTTVSMNLATGLSEKGTRPVLLLEADVYRPTLLKKLGLKPWPGLTECCRFGTDPMQSIRRIDPLGFYLLPAGQPVEDGSTPLQSNLVSQLIKNLSSSSFGWVLIDSPPTTPIADILLLRGLADGTLLVGRAGATPREAIEETTRNLGRDHIVGFVLNGVEGLDRTYSKYYGYGASEAPRKSAKPKTVAGLGLNRYGK